MCIRLGFIIVLKFKVLKYYKFKKTIANGIRMLNVCWKLIYIYIQKKNLRFRHWMLGTFPRLAYNGYYHLAF